MKQFKYYLMAAFVAAVTCTQDSIPVATMMMKKVLLILLWM